MKRSDHVVISAVLLAAISTATASGQEVATDSLRRDTTAQPQKTVYVDNVVTVRHSFFYRINFFRWFGWGGGSGHSHQNHEIGPRTPRPPAGPGTTSSGPRTNGFGNSLRKTSASS